MKSTLVKRREKKPCAEEMERELDRIVKLNESQNRALDKIISLAGTQKEMISETIYHKHFRSNKILLWAGRIRNYLKNQISIL